MITTIAKEILPQINDLVKLIQERKLAILCGAGISINPPSNLPSVIAIRKAIIGKLVTQYQLDNNIRMKLEGRIDDEKNKSNPQQLQYPFEAFIQTVDTHAPILSRLLKIFNSGLPNKNHILLAHLIKNGYIRELMTTNFDSKIEEALEKPLATGGYGGKKGIDFRVFSKESEFLKLNCSSKKLPIILKVHGTLEDRESIRATLESVSKREMREARTQILRYFFQESEHDILILGYSVSDEFDINPVLRSLKSQNRIFIIKHMRKDSNEKPRIYSLADPFQSFKGIIIKCNTDEVVDYIWNKFVKKTCEKTVVTEDWTHIMEEWAQSLHEWQRLFLMGLIFENIYDYSNAEKLYKESLSISKTSGNQSNMCRSLHQLATIKTKSGKYAEARKRYTESLQIKKQLKDQHAIATSLYELGNLSYLRGQYEEAEDLFKQSLKIRERIGDQKGLLVNFGSLANLEEKRKKFNDAFTYYQKVLKLSQKIGLKKYELRAKDCLRRIAFLSRNQKKT